VTIGVFDGVHRGHRVLLDAVRQAAARAGGTAAAVTFRPPPARILRPEVPLQEITPWPEKRALLQAAGIERIVPLRFTRALAAQAPEAFVREVLLQQFDLAGLVIGYDFRFGARGAGDAGLLRRMGRGHGFRVRAIGAVRYAGRPISSTRIRNALARGRVDLAGAMLGRPFAVWGRVVAGRGLGTRRLVPTANLRPAPTQLLPADGVYLTRLRHRGRTWGGVAHVGGTPTLGGPIAAPIEVHLLDFTGSLHGARLSLEFLARHRESRRFAGFRELRRAILEDVRWARGMFARGGENRLAWWRMGC